VRARSVAALGAVLGTASVATWGGGLQVAIAAAVLGASLGLARDHPLAAWLVATAALLATAPYGVLDVPTYVLVPAHAFCAGRWDRRWSGLAGAVALIAVSELAVYLDHEAAVPAAFVPAAAWFAGRALREREQIVVRLAQRARELDDEREVHARLSVRYERARIAAELHDIVAHALSVMVVQASAGQRLAAVDPQLTAETFEVIAGAAQQAERDIGRLVDLLADEGPTRSLADLELIGELVTRARRSGLHVTLRHEGERERLPVEIAQTAYRVVQEGLTNALRYASGAPVAVLVRAERTAVLVTVSNEPAAHAPDLAGTGTGNGLLGLRERVGAAGGTLEAGSTPDGGWTLVARLPLHAAASHA
jgi:signal transduction histidine kinase